MKFIAIETNDMLCKSERRDLLKRTVLEAFNILDKGEQKKYSLVRNH